MISIIRSLDKQLRCLRRRLLVTQRAMDCGRCDAGSDARCKRLMVDIAIYESALATQREIAS